MPGARLIPRQQISLHVIALRFVLSKHARYSGASAGAWGCLQADL